jgi:hypothetical protein
LKPNTPVVLRVARNRIPALNPAIATEATRRGWGTTVPDGPKNQYGRNVWTATKCGHLQLQAGSELFCDSATRGACLRIRVWMRLESP